MNLNFNDFEKGTYGQEQCLNAFLELVDAFNETAKISNYLEDDGVLEDWMKLLQKNKAIPSLK